MSLKNPIRRDTVAIPGNGYAVIQFRADNPGVWVYPINQFFHCHIEWHLHAGLASLFVEAPLELQVSLKIPDYFYKQCANQGVKTSGNAAGYDDATTFNGFAASPKLHSVSIRGKAIYALCGCVFSAFAGFGTLIWFLLIKP